MLPRYSRTTTATTQTTESENHVLKALCHERFGTVSSTTTMPAVTRKPAATARRQWSNATVAKDATTTAHMAACVNSYPMTDCAHRRTSETQRPASGDHHSSTNESALATVSVMSRGPSSR